MKKASVSSNSLGSFLSAGGSNSTENGAFSHKGWSSERVPHPSTTSISRRHIGSSSSLTTPFYCGKTIPSKWEDAGRWICSPVAAYPSGVCKKASASSQFSEQRRMKSKSGPIMPPPSATRIGCYYYSPAAMQVLEAPPESIRGLMVGSPFSTGVLEAERVYRGNNGVGGADGYAMIDLVSDSSSSSSKEENADEIKEAETTLSPVVLRRDMATQMSPKANSPNRDGEKASSAFYPSPPSILSVIDSQHESPSSPMSKVREVKVDKQAEMIKRSKRRQSRITKRSPLGAEHAYKNTASASAWEISEPAMRVSKLQREEAKIAAWENLQKAKAEAAIRKLEVKLEKKKSASMDKILNKLQTAQLKAREMRCSISSRHDDQIPKSSNTITALRRHTFISSFTSCFTSRIDCRSSFDLKQ